MICNNCLMVNRHSPLSRNYPSPSLHCSPHLRRNYLQEYEAVAHHQPLFSFDDRPHPTPHNPFPAFELQPYKEESAAHPLIEENQHLRQQLRHSQELIRDLEAQIEAQLQQGQYRNRQCKQEERSALDEVREQLWAIYSRNQQLEQEVEELQQMVIQKQLAGNLIYLQRQHHQSPPHKDTFLPHCSNKGGKDFGRGEEECFERLRELVESIRSMYWKVRGEKAASLKEIWRWLKYLGQLCSGLGKWRMHALGVIRQNPHPSRLLRLLDEVLILSD